MIDDPLKNRLESLKGEDHSSAKLTNDDVRLIRQLLAERKRLSQESQRLTEQLSQHKKTIRELSHQKIGEKFSVHRTTISSIAYGKNWSYLQ